MNQSEKSEKPEDRIPIVTKRMVMEAVHKVSDMVETLCADMESVEMGAVHTTRWHSECLKIVDELGMEGVDGDGPVVFRVSVLDTIRKLRDNADQLSKEKAELEQSTVTVKKYEDMKLLAMSKVSELAQDKAKVKRLTDEVEGLREQIGNMAQAHTKEIGHILNRAEIAEMIPSAYKLADLLVQRKYRERIDRDGIESPGVLSAALDELERYP